MKPPYDITPEILYLISSISEKIGAINAGYLNRIGLQIKMPQHNTIEAFFIWYLEFGPDSHRDGIWCFQYWNFHFLFTARFVMTCPLDNFTLAI